MSVEQIIKESLEKNPVDLKNIVEEELKARLRARLEEKNSEKAEGDDEDDDEDKM